MPGDSSFPSLGMDTPTNSPVVLRFGWVVALAALVVPVATAQAPSDKYKSPRATMRTRYMAIDLVGEYPRHIEEAFGCLDLSDRPQAKPYGGLLATKLEAILRAKDVTSAVLSKETTDEVFVIPDTN